VTDAGQDSLSPIFSIVPVVVPSCLLPFAQQAAGGSEIMGAMVRSGSGQKVLVEVEWYCVVT
jgi:hypothetical protein